MRPSWATTQKHICGGPLRMCSCGRYFCTQCEANLCTAYQKNGLKQCCRKAIIDYWTDHEQPIRQEVTIEDVSDGKL